MKTSEPRAIRLKDYKVPNYLIETVDLKFEIFENFTRVTSTAHFKRHPHGEKDAPLVLDGEELKLIRVELEGKELTSENYLVTDTHLTLSHVPAEFDLKIVTEIEPDKNTALEGLYRSGQMLCTQNEAEGFRRITYFLDRPDVMAVYTTSIEADKKRYPILLSNGNLIEKSDLAEGRHFVKWHDPYKKPCYLFALVAGDLGMIADSHTTNTGRKIRLEIYVDKGDEARARHAMTSLQQAMKWDEDTFGLEYDLDIYMIVSAHSFNAGAMENKGLNIFNSRLVLADAETATDAEFEAIQGVIGHEYFHNWTGDRITCRDWFQLSLKEGLTVFRDQEFSSDMNSRAVKRIDDVDQLRTRQFAEDAGPMAHPIRPSTYITIDNFYTATVYEKGAEVIRMIHTLLGAKGFRKGMDKYFELFDGQAVTTDDFVTAMEKGSGVDLTQFRRWYAQAGTPQLRFEENFDAAAKRYTLTLKQINPPTPGDTGPKEPLHLPVATALLGPQGQEIQSQILELKEAMQSFSFEGISEKPVLSLLRGFSAPVKVMTERSEEDLLFLMAHDGDSFSRWEATQQISLSNWQKLVGQIQGNKELALSEKFLEAFGPILEDADIDEAFKAQLLALPDVNYFIQSLESIDPDAVMRTREFILQSVARKHRQVLEGLYEKLSSSNNQKIGPEFSGPRALRNTVLAILSYNPDFDTLNVAAQQFKDAKNMTTRMGALQVLTHLRGEKRDQVFAEFYERFRKDPVTIDKWFQLQAVSRREDTLAQLHVLEKDPVFDIKNPNKCRSLYSAFASRNLWRFHDPSGAGYKFFADRVLKMDTLNPQLAGRVLTAMNNWKRFEPSRRALMKTELERILSTPKLSENSYEVASKALK